ncbi:MAG: RDD family protein [Betaproteobacteria bacterium]|nr:RDD family protein [Betaproteobacteria bacterium]
MQLASLRLRLVSLVYEGTLLFAVLFVSSYLFLSVARDAQSGLPRVIFQIYLLSVCGAYFVFCWARTGQTLPMKTWRIRIVTEEGGGPSVGRAVKRYLLAIPGILSGISLLWAPFDRERQFLHDRLAGTRIVRVNVDR